MLAFFFSSGLYNFTVTVTMVLSMSQPSWETLGVTDQSQICTIVEMDSGWTVQPRVPAVRISLSTAVRFFSVY